MNQYETGKHTPDYFTLTRIAKILKVPTAYFYVDDDLLAKIILVIDGLTKRTKQELLININRLDG